MTNYTYLEHPLLSVCFENWKQTKIRKLCQALALIEIQFAAITAGQNWLSLR